MSLRSLQRACACLAAAAVGLALGAVPAGASVTPPSATLTIAPGGTGVDPVSVQVPSPVKGDIEIAIDTTGSMGGSISQAQAQATQLVNDVQAYVPNSQFAVVEFRDSGDTPEYAVRQSMTPNAAPVQAAINAMSAGGGGDLPEAHNLVFHNSYTPALGGPLGWRSGATPIVVVISDAEPHGAATAGMVNCADTSADPHGYNTAVELTGMNANSRVLFMVRAAATASTTLACYQSIASHGAPGSQGVDLGSNLGAQIVTLLNGTSTTITDLHLTAVSASPAPATTGWITSYSPASYSGFNAPATKTFSINVAVPASTPSGTYTFDIMAVADGSDIGHHILNIIVRRDTADLDVQPGVVTATTSPPGASAFVLTLNAYLTDHNTHAPLPGEVVNFYSTPSIGNPATYLCSATTTFTGLATCNATVSAIASAALGNGIDGFFNGNANYNPATDHAALFYVNGNPFP
jgi:hypothetical protein